MAGRESSNGVQLAGLPKKAFMTYSVLRGLVSFSDGCLRQNGIAKNANEQCGLAASGTRRIRHWEG